MADNFADRLLIAIRRNGAPVCVGIDPSFPKLPAAAKAGGDELAAIERFSLGVVEAVAGVVPAVKPQIAYFERYGAAGVAVCEKVISAARRAGLIVILDAKRNDIGSTAAEYAAGWLGREDSSDALTVNGYLGADGIQPFLDVAAPAGKGIFVLVRTSNPSAKTTQDFTDTAGRKYFERMAELVAGIGEGAGLVGRLGYSCVGAVVGATYREEAARLREVMPRQVFLVPGYGAQGATADDCAVCFRGDGQGAIVNASRSVLYPKDARMAGDWKSAVHDAAVAFAKDVARASRP